MVTGKRSNLSHKFTVEQKTVIEPFFAPIIPCSFILATLIKYCFNFSRKPGWNKCISGFFVELATIKKTDILQKMRSPYVF